VNATTLTTATPSAIAPPAPSRLTPQIAIVIPVFKHGVLVGEAITCALQQKTELTLAIVLVNDGCPFAETDRICRDFATAYPQQVFYLYRPNGGLSAARNTGINFVLSTWESVQAIYLLDADNRLATTSIDLAFRCLCEHPEAGWVYPTINMFGQESNYDFRGDYSVLRHLKLNLCEAGSLVRREVFEAGCRYDESMKLGFEDWEFWWQAIAAGFRGRHLPEFGFQYRKRPESMVKNSERDSAGILDYMRRKHRQLFTHRQALKLEHEEAPRYALILSDTGQIALTSDPAVRDVCVSISGFHTRYKQAFTNPTWYDRPPLLVFTRSTILNALQHKGLLHWVFWRLELAQRDTNFVGLAIDPTSDRSTIVIDENSVDVQLVSGETDHLVMTSIQTLDECIRDSSEGWIQSLLTPNPEPNCFRLKLTYNDRDRMGAYDAGALYQLISVFKDLRRKIRPLLDRPTWNWQDLAFPPRSHIPQEAREILECDVIYPKLVEARSRHIGLILPILEFGGVEKVALNIAVAFQQAGWGVHLFIFNTQMQELPDWAHCVDTINFFNEPSMYQWEGSPYMGSTYDRWSQYGDRHRVVGLFSWLNAAINFHSVAANGLMGLLRRRGLKAIVSLHVHDLTPWGRTNGFSHLALGYEHAYDYLIPCSQQMANWCHAMGVPQEKTIVVPNACGYPLESAQVEAILARRGQRPVERKLRVLFIGRFDRQKGLDRLVGIVQAARQQQLPIEWRLVGKNVVKTEDAALELAPISEFIEPPAMTNDALNEVYEWADVLLLPSYWEGLPLTVLEAMRLGVVVCAADVGAMAEAIDADRTGILVPNFNGDAFVSAAIRVLSDLIDRPEERVKIQQAAVAAAARRSWEEACAEFVEKLEGAIAD
jgi:glycosyltransferase involved in cell wall biosynthesis